MKKFFYRVLVGDTVLSLSQKFNIPLFTLINLNSLTKEISSGDLLYIEIEDAKTYSVKPLEDFCSIAEKLGTTELKLRADNPVKYPFYGLILKL